MRTGGNVFSLLLHSFSELCCASVGAPRGKAGPWLAAGLCLTTELLSPPRSCATWSDWRPPGGGWWQSYLSGREDLASLHLRNKH